MSYQVIARKWRPKNFDELVGQSHVRKTLLNALRGGRLPHALLFSGARGVGKTSSARILAKSLRCISRNDFTPCNQCVACEDINSGSSLDVIEIDGASNNGVDAIRELRETVGYMPSSGKHKVYIIDEVHMLSTSAFNALLKTLEEPPQHVIFIFATTEPQKIPVTILSRCQRFDLRRIATREIVDRLAYICKAEGVDAEQEALWTLARQGEGSLRDAQSLLDQLITFSDGRITSDAVTDVLGLTDRTLLHDVLRAIVTQNSQAVVAILEKISISGYDHKVFVQDLLLEVRHLLIVKVSSQFLNSGQILGGDLLDIPDNERERLKELDEFITEENLHLLFDMALKGANDVTRSSTPNLVLEVLLLRMASSPRIETLEKLFSKVPSANANTTAPITNMAKISLGTTPSNTSKETDAAQRWIQLVSRIKGVQPSLAAQLEHVSFLGVQDSEISLGVRKGQEFIFSKLSEKPSVDKVTNYIKTFWGQNLNVKIKLISDTTVTNSIYDETRRAASEEEARIRMTVENHPLIQKTKDIFRADVKDIQNLTSGPQQKKATTLTDE